MGVKRSLSHLGLALPAVLLSLSSVAYATPEKPAFEQRRLGVEVGLRSLGEQDGRQGSAELRVSYAMPMWSTLGLRPFVSGAANSDKGPYFSSLSLGVDVEVVLPATEEHGVGISTGVGWVPYATFSRTGVEGRAGAELHASLSHRYVAGPAIFESGVRYTYGGLASEGTTHVFDALSLHLGLQF